MTHLSKPVRCTAPRGKPSKPQTLGDIVTHGPFAGLLMMAGGGGGAGGAGEGWVGAPGESLYLLLSFSVYLKLL